MKVCFFNSTKLWGGGEKWHFDHALALQQEGHEVVVVSNKNSELLKRAKQAGIRVAAYSIGNLSFLNPFKLWLLFRFFTKEQFDVLILNFSSDLKVAAPAAKWAKVRKIVYRRGSDIPIRNTFLNRFLFGRCLTDVLANSEATKRSILHNNQHLFPASKIKVIYNGIVLPPPVISTENAVPVVATLGRLVHQKGIDILLSIAVVLKQRGVNCRMRIGGDGVLMQELLRRRQEYDLSDYVEFTGFVNDPHAFMSQIDIFVLTSRWEGFGYVLTEAMLAGKPLVAFDVSSNPELVKDGVNGYLIPFGDVEKFADAVQALVEQPQQRRLFGTAGRQLVAGKFDFEKNKQQLIAYLTPSI